MSVVAIEYNPKRSEIIKYNHDGTVQKEIYHQWLISQHTPYTPKGVLRYQKLRGNNPLKNRIWYRDDTAFKSASGAIKGQGGIVYFDPIQQYLADHPEYKYFKDMKFDQLKRIAFDLETTGLNPEKDHILMCGIAFEDGYNKAICEGTEEDIIWEINETIKNYNPDVIEGWNIYGFDIPFLIKRAEKLGMTLNWGRDGSDIYKERTKQFRVGSYSRPIEYYRCHGRHLLDGMLIAMRFDVNVGGKFESYSLKSVAKVLGVQEEDRLILDRGTLEEQWYEDEAKVIKYCIQDCKETISCMNIIAQPDFYLTNLLPDTFQHITVSGGATKINQLLVSDYIMAGESIPIGPNVREDYEGGYVELRNAGVFHHVGKVDVSSLYPSIMLTFDVVPPQDTLGVFKKKLAELTKMRLTLKDLKNKAESKEDHIYYQGMEKAYKVVINSFYGYLGTTGMNFADFDAAGQVTSIGRDIVCDMAEQLEAMGLLVIEVDTDGIYFQHEEIFPTDMIPKVMMLPEGIKVDMDEAYKCMVAVKAKNYVLIGSETTKYHGNSLRSRRDEKFGQDFLKDTIEALVADKPETVYAIYKAYQEEIINRDFDIDDMVGRERVSEKTLTSPMKKRLAAAVGQTDIVEGEYIYVYNREDGSLAPKDLYDNDYNRFYYLDRLHKFAQRIQPVLDIYGIDLPRMGKLIFKKEYGGK